MSNLDPTPDDYRAHIHVYDDELLDSVATQEEWKRFKEAVALWVADIDAEYDQLAINEEHGDV